MVAKERPPSPGTYPCFGCGEAQQRGPDDWSPPICAGCCSALDERLRAAFPVLLRAFEAKHGAELRAFRDKGQIEGAEWAVSLDDTDDDIRAICEHAVAAIVYETWARYCEGHIKIGLHRRDGKWSPKWYFPRIDEPSSGFVDDDDWFQSGLAKVLAERITTRWLRPILRNALTQLQPEAVIARVLVVAADDRSVGADYDELVDVASFLYSQPISDGAKSLMDMRCADANPGGNFYTDTGGWDEAVCEWFVVLDQLPPFAQRVLLAWQTWGQEVFVQ